MNSITSLFVSPEVGGVCVGNHKTFACARVGRHASARSFHTEFILYIPPFFLLNNEVFLPRKYLRLGEEFHGRKPAW